MVDATVAQGHKDVAATQRLWVRSPFEGVNYNFLIISFLRTTTRQKPIVEFRHLLSVALSQSLDKLGGK